MGGRLPGSEQVHYRPQGAPHERFAHPPQPPTMQSPSVSTGSNVSPEIQRLLAQRQYMIDQSQAANMVSAACYFPYTFQFLFNVCDVNVSTSEGIDINPADIDVADL